MRILLASACLLAVSHVFGLGLRPVLASGLSPENPNDPAEAAYARALALLAAGDPAGAESAAREALRQSANFLPEKEIAVAPEKKLLFEDMISRARESYRSRRARYFLALGQGLSRQERWAEASKPLRKSLGLAPSAEALMTLALDPDLTTGERIRLLLDAFFAPGAQSERIVPELLATGAFRNGTDLQAAIDLAGFQRQAKPLLEAWVEPLADFRVVTDSGTWVAREQMEAARALMLYFPSPGCGGCSETLDNLSRILAREKAGDLRLALFVSEPDLSAARQIVRLMGMKVEVGRSDRLPDSMRPAPEGEIRVSARKGLLQFRIKNPAEAEGESLRRQLQAILRLVHGQDVPPEASGVAEKLSALDRLTREGRHRQALSELIELARPLEAGPLPFQELSDRLDRILRSFLAEPISRAQLLELVEKISALAGAGKVKARLLSALDKDYSRKILTAARSSVPDLEKEAPSEEGVFLTALAGSGSPGKHQILLQRSLLREKSVQHFNFILRSTDTGLEVAWAGPEKEFPQGAEGFEEGAVFFFKRADGTAGIRVVGAEGVLYERSPAHVEKGQVVEEVEALVDSVPSGEGPAFYRRGKIERGHLVAPETALEKGLRSFREGKYREAAAFFEAASRSIDPLAPYDETDIRYNLARCSEALGERQKALALLRSIGDAVYQPLVEERLGRLEGRSPR